MGYFTLIAGAVGVVYMILRLADNIREEEFSMINIVGVVIALFILLLGIVSPKNSEEELESHIDVVIGNKQQEVTVVDDGTNNKVVNIEMLHHGKSKMSYLYECEHILKSIFGYGNDIAKVNLQINAVFVDKKGAEEVRPAVMIGMTRETESGITWKNIDAKNVPTLADEYTEDRVINRN